MRVNRLEFRVHRNSFHPRASLQFPLPTQFGRTPQSQTLLEISEDRQSPLATLWTPLRLCRMSVAHGYFRHYWQPIYGDRSPNELRQWLWELGATEVNTSGLRADQIDPNHQMLRTLAELLAIHRD